MHYSAEHFSAEYCAQESCSDEFYSAKWNSLYCCFIDFFILGKFYCMLLCQVSFGKRCFSCCCSAECHGTFKMVRRCFIDMTFNLHDISPTEKMHHIALRHGVSLTHVIYVAFYLPTLQNLMKGHLTVCHFNYIVIIGS